MKVSELITELKKHKPDADVQFFDHKEDKMLNLHNVDAGTCRGAHVVVIGEVPMEAKQASAKVKRDLKGATQPTEDYSKLFTDMFSGFRHK